MERQENMKNVLEGFTMESLQKILETIPENAPYTELTAKQKAAQDIAAHIKAQELLQQAPSPSDEKLPFNWNNISKKEVFAHILAIARQSGFACSMSKVISFLSKFTNLGNEHTIHSQIYYYK
ncbi:MAG: hypothetical protein IJ200_07350 [Prevotella sp.]|nr:hypothetical protein [Prevotella sp.]